MTKTRLTNQRKIIYDAVMSRCDHPTAEQIFLDVHERYPKISKSTVYRNLDILEKEKKIYVVESSDAKRYDSTSKNHYHVHCLICGKVIDTMVPYDFKDDKKVSMETDFIIQRHNLVFEGICPECQQKLNEKNGEEK